MLNRVLSNVHLNSKEPQMRPQQRVEFDKVCLC